MMSETEKDAELDVPTTEEIRAFWAERFTDGEREFEAWLVAHDAEVRAAQREADARIVEEETGWNGALATQSTLLRHQIGERVAAAIRGTSDD